MMEREENISANITTSDLLRQMLADEKDGQAFTEAFLKSSFLSSAVDTLFCARRQAGLTQAQIAGIMQTKQAAIARLEADTNGSMSLRRYVEFALACGMVPLDIKLVPLSSVYNYIVDNPEKPRTVEAYYKWLIAKEQALPAKGTIVQAVSNTAQTAMTATAKALQEAQQAQKYFRPSLVQEQQESNTINTASNSELSTVAEADTNHTQPFISKTKVAA